MSNNKVFIQIKQSGESLAKHHLRRADGVGPLRSHILSTNVYLPTHLQLGTHRTTNTMHNTETCMKDSNCGAALVLIHYKYEWLTEEGQSRGGGARAERQSRGRGPASRGRVDLDLSREARARQLEHVAVHGARQRLNARRYVLRLLLTIQRKFSFYNIFNWRKFTMNMHCEFKETLIFKLINTYY